jgi:hypothetical protein
LFELVLNTQFSTVFMGTPFVSPSDAVLFINGAVSAVPFTTASLGNNAWSVTFTPTVAGVYTFAAYGAVQFRAQCSAKSLYTYLTNLEDEALGSWSWNKASGVLTVLRQNGSILATHNLIDDLSVSSRERVS